MCKCHTWFDANYLTGQLRRRSKTQAAFTYSGTRKGGRYYLNFFFSFFPWDFLLLFYSGFILVIIHIPCSVCECSKSICCFDFSYVNTISWLFHTMVSGELLFSLLVEIHQCFFRPFVFLQVLMQACVSFLGGPMMHFRCSSSGQIS